MPQGARTTRNSQATEDTLRMVQAALESGGDTEQALQDILTALGGAPQKRIEISQANDDGTEIELDTGVNDGLWELVAVRALQSGGTSTTSQYSLGEATGFSAGDIDAVITASGATAKGSLVNDNYVQPIPCQADGDGKLYLLSGRDANNDSTFAAVVTLRRAVTV